MACRFQLLFEGRYDGYLQPDVHYIPLKKDLSNVDEALRKFRDHSFTTQVTDNAHRLVTEEFTYGRLIDRFAASLAPLPLAPTKVARIAPGLFFFFALFDVEDRLNKLLSFLKN